MGRAPGSGDHFAQFIDAQVQTGRYGSTSDALRAGLRLLEEHEAKVKALQDALIAGEEPARPRRSTPRRSSSPLGLVAGRMGGIGLGLGAHLDVIAGLAPQHVGQLALAPADPVAGAAAALRAMVVFVGAVVHLSSPVGAQSKPADCGFPVAFR
jgi:antitoxin ParD1/3/4